MTCNPHAIARRVTGGGHSDGGGGHCSHGPVKSHLHAVPSPTSPLSFPSRQMPPPPFRLPPPLHTPPRCFTPACLSRVTRYGWRIKGLYWHRREGDGMRQWRREGSPHSFGVVFRLVRFLLLIFPLRGLSGQLIQQTLHRGGSTEKDRSERS